MAAHNSEPAALRQSRFEHGEYIQKGMIAVRVSKDHRAAIVGALSYFESHPKPKSVRDLLSQRCINFRHGAAGVYRWEFARARNPCPSR
jgi:hypothetical protein